jgi:hypothetical protein
MQGIGMPLLEYGGDIVKQLNLLISRASSSHD